VLHASWKLADTCWLFISGRRQADDFFADADISLPIFAPPLIYFEAIAALSLAIIFAISLIIIAAAFDYADTIAICTIFLH